MIGLIAAAVLTLRVLPAACLSPCVVKAIIKVEGSRNGDVMKVEFESDEYHASTINVTEGRKTYELPLTPMSGGGQGLILVTLTRRDGSVWTERVFIEMRNGEVE